MLNFTRFNGVYKHIYFSVIKLKAQIKGKLSYPHTFTYIFCLVPHIQISHFISKVLVIDAPITSQDLGLMIIMIRIIAWGSPQSFGCCVAVSLPCFGRGNVLVVFLRCFGAPAISWCLTLDFIGVLQWLQAVLRDIDCPAPPRPAPHNADEWTRGPAKSN